MVERVTIVGAGLMGAQIGTEYALGGHTVTLVTSSQASAGQALERANSALRFLVESGLAADDAVRSARQRLRTSTDVAEACRGATIVLESLPENFETKVAILRPTVSSAPEAIIASNTSSLSITKLGAALRVAERVIGTHYWNPPSLMPLVEVVSGASTAPDVTERVVALLTSLGKEPVLVADVTGFVWNRLQLALLREAVSIVSQGITDAKTVDLILRRGLGRRWSIIGPFETMALGGPKTFATVARILFPHLASELDPDDLLKMKLPEASDEARRRRDRALARWRLADRRQEDVPQHEPR